MVDWKSNRHGYVQIVFWFGTFEKVVPPSAKGPPFIRTVTGQTRSPSALRSCIGARSVANVKKVVQKSYKVVADQAVVVVVGEETQGPS